MIHHQNSTKYNEADFKKLIIKAIQASNQGLTIADMVVLTGLPTDWVEFTVRKMLCNYPCRLRTNPTGDLVYIFDLKGKKNPIRNRILSFLFNPKKQKDKYFIEKIILHYIRNNGGKIVVAEIIQITGWSLYEAELQATKLLADYKGDVYVTEEGVIIYTFEDLATTIAESDVIKASLKIWERPIPEKEIIQKSIIHLTLPLRKFRIYLENEKIRMKNVESFLLKGIFNRIQTHISPENDLKKMIYESKPERFYKYWWNQEISNSSFEFAFVMISSYHREILLEKKAIELEAEINVDENGVLYYDFERLNRELKVIAALR